MFPHYYGQQINRMAEAEEAMLRIKFVINKERSKVLFAEAGSDLTDVLLSFLRLPLGTIMKHLQKCYEDEAPVVGSLSTLYKGVASLDTVHFQTEDAKNKLLDPPSGYDRWPKLGGAYGDAFTESSASFIISNDLRVMPNVADSVVETLNNLSISMIYLDGAVEKNLIFGYNEIMALLKESLTSREPLTSLFLGGSRKNSGAVMSGQGNTLFHQLDKRAIDTNTKKMVLKVMIQKSTNKFLFAQAGRDFINFLFGMLTFPLGSVEWYLCSHTGLRAVDNLHKSVDNLDNKHMRSLVTKGLLLNPVLSTQSTLCNELVRLNFHPNINQNHVKGSRMYMVSDDLTVAPLGVTSSLSVIKRMEISTSDVEQLELQVGIREGLGILKAALTLTTALTDGLVQLKASLASNRLQKRLKQKC